MNVLLPLPPTSSQSSSNTSTSSQEAQKREFDLPGSFITPHTTRTILNYPDGVVGEVDEAWRMGGGEEVWCTGMQWEMVVGYQQLQEHREQEDVKEVGEYMGEHIHRQSHDDDESNDESNDEPNISNLDFTNTTSTSTSTFTPNMNAPNTTHATHLSLLSTPPPSKALNVYGNGTYPATPYNLLRCPQATTIPASAYPITSLTAYPYTIHLTPTITLQFPHEVKSGHRYRVYTSDFYIDGKTGAAGIKVLKADAIEGQNKGIIDKAREERMKIINNVPKGIIPFDCTQENPTAAALLTS